MARSVAFLLLTVGSLLGLVWSDCGLPVFRERAGDMVKTSFKKGFHNMDFTKIEVELSVFDLMENGNCITGDQMGLQYSNDGGRDWKSADFKLTSIGGGQYKFTIEDIIPCKNYYFKIIFSGEIALYF